MNFIRSVFFDTQRQIIDDDGVFEVEYPAIPIPPGGWLPFKIVAFNIIQADDYELVFHASPTNNLIHRNFEFSELEAISFDDDYCISGIVQNLGNNLQGQLLIIITLYNDQDQVIDYTEDYIAVSDLPANQYKNFETCFYTTYPNVNRFEVQGWGY